MPNRNPNFTPLSKANLPPDLTRLFCKLGIDTVEALWSRMDTSPDLVKPVFDALGVDFDQSRDRLQEMIPASTIAYLNQLKLQNDGVMGHMGPRPEDDFRERVENLDLYRIPGVLSVSKCIRRDRGDGLFVVIDAPSVADKIPDTHNGKFIDIELPATTSFALAYSYNSDRLEDDLSRGELVASLSALAEAAGAEMRKQHTKHLARIKNGGVTQVYVQGSIGVFWVYSHNREFLVTFPDTFMDFEKGPIEEIRL